MSQVKCDPLCQKPAVQPLYQGAEGAITPLTLWQPPPALGHSTLRGSQVRNGLTAGGNRIRTLSPAGKKTAELCEREPDSGYASGKAENMIA